MRTRRIAACVLAALTFSTGWVRAQNASHRITLNVQLTGSGAADTLTAADFRLTDNKRPVPVVSAKHLTAGSEPVSVIIVVDAVNVPFTRVAYERSQTEKYLQANGGHLAQPTTLVVLTDKGAQIQKGFTTDGAAIAKGLESADIGLREIRRSAGIWGADERVDISLNALKQLIGYAGTVQGRKLVLWVSPGWPLLSGPHIDLDGKQQRQIFDNIVAFSTGMQKANMTLYNVNPLGPEENLSAQNYYEAFLKGVSKPSQTDIGDLSLQVLAAQSGGRVLTGSSDVSGSLAKCVADAKEWYEIAFDAAPAESGPEFHPIELSVDKPGVTARTRTGYYAQP